MDSLTARVSVVIVMLGCLECSYVYFDRRCPAWQISHGIRKETWEKETILYCFQFDTNDTNSRHICKKLMSFYAKFLQNRSLRILFTFMSYRSGLLCPYHLFCYDIIRYVYRLNRRTYYLNFEIACTLP